ncbi:DHH family phosphoesterase [Halodesulfurarchaeum sp.]|uniref:DHH family phosphoesterase n=1 Tax=Halodesulfurarchaeum sp. TaxID=1980530 RepID=UPI002FC3AAA0
MVDRLVLGCGDLCLSLSSTIRDWEGELLVLDPDEHRVEHLRDLSVSAETGDVTKTEAIRAASIEPDVIIVLMDDRERATEVAYAARDVYPEAYVLSLPGVTGTSSQVPAAVDSVLSPGSMVLDAIDDNYGGVLHEQLAGLRTTLQGMSGTLVICTHDNPDPDALGAALALRAIAERFEVSAEICYFGDISHQENRAFVNLLDVSLRQLERPADIGGDHLALVDHSRPGVNDQLPQGMPIDIVIDHHPAEELPDADFMDVRSSVGATSTLLIDYLEGYDIDIGTDVATGLLYGIRVDTRNFGRETTGADFEAAATLLPHADLDALERIESPSMSPYTLETIGRAIQNRRVEGTILTSCVGSIQSRDSLAQAADRLLELEAIDMTVVYGYTDETIYLSGRAKAGRLDLGFVFRRAFDDIGSAGGHESMAGAQLPLGIFEAVETETEENGLRSMVAGQIENRIDDALDTRRRER